jgi:hypothetical protein
MYITRYKISKIRHNLKNFLLNQKNNKKTKFRKLAYHICRSKNIKFEFKKTEDLLDNIEFITDIIYNHWAETDGKTIFINNIKDYNYKILYDTIKHEMLHGLIRRNDNSELSEHLEHKFMYLLDPKLISI